jgi:hypothetical protein
MIYRFLLWLLGFEEICKQVDAIERELKANARSRANRSRE